MASISHYYNKLSENTRLNLELIVAPILGTVIAGTAFMFVLASINNALSMESPVEPQSSPSQSSQISPKP